MLYQPPRTSGAAPNTALTMKLYLHKELGPLRLSLCYSTTLLLTSSLLPKHGCVAFLSATRGSVIKRCPLNNLKWMSE